MLVVLMSVVMVVVMMKRCKMSRADSCDGHCNHHGKADDDGADEADVVARQRVTD